jgi:outer membrane biosynthesis protein TonB
MPAYPLTARSMNACWNVEAGIAISEAGQVIEATAISGRPTLRRAAVDAAREWVYKPMTPERQPHEGRNSFDFHLCPWFSITKIQTCCLQE